MAKNNNRSNPEGLLTIGLDVGYGAVKAVTSDATLVFPSVCGHAREIKFQQDEIAIGIRGIRFKMMRVAGLLVIWH